MGAHVSARPTVMIPPTPSHSALSSTCPFCHIVQGQFPSLKVAESELSYAFIPLPPVTQGHTLVIPKHHAVKMHELPDEYLADVVALAKKIAIDHKFVDYNIIQNNGRIAYQTVDHVHFHIIPKPDEDTGLVVVWPPHKSPEELKRMRRELFSRLGGGGKISADPQIQNDLIREIFETNESYHDR